MRMLTLFAFGCLIANGPMAIAQGTGGGGASSSGGGARGGGATAGPGTTAPTAPGSAAPTSPSVNAPAAPAPGVGNTQVDPGRSLNANPPIRSIEGAAPGTTTGSPTSAPSPRVEQPGVSAGAAGGKAAARPGAAQSPNSDGYAECMAMGPANGDTSSRENWSATCDRARLPPKSP